MTATISDLKALFPGAPSPAELELIALYAMQPEDGRRARAFEAFSRTGLPHRRMEAWKWSDFRAGLKAIATPKTASAFKPLPAGDGAAVIKVRRGKFSLPDLLPEGIKLHQLDSAEAFAQAEEMPLGAMTAALSAQGALIVEVTGPAAGPIHIVCEGDGDEANFSRIAVVARKGSTLDLIESHLGGAGFSAFLVEVSIEDGGAVRRTLLQRGTKDEAQAITAAVTLGEGASYTQTQLAFGAKLARLETRLTHHESASRAVLNAAYLCADGYHADLTSHVRHGAPSSETEQITKGAVLSGGTGVFQGKFHVPRHIGQHTKADMQHQALLLEEGAAVFAKPELEIYADDVECAHGNTSGALDETQLFYLRQRGIPLAQARAMLTEAFIAEALEEASDTARDALVEAAGRFLAEAIR